MTATETVEAVGPGAVRILSPAANSVSISAGLQTEVRVALNWTVKLELNGEQVSDTNIGVRSLITKTRSRPSRTWVSTLGPVRIEFVLRP